MDFSFIEDAELRAKAEAAHTATISSITSEFDAKLNDAVERLKSKNEELITEKRKLQEKFSLIKDPEEAFKALQFLNENEDARLIKEGKIDEVIARRTDGLRGDYEAKITELAASLNLAKEEGSTYAGLYKTKMVEDVLRDVALGAKVRSSAVTDVLTRGKSVFALAPDNKTVEARDAKGKLVMTVDERVLTPALWIESLKKEAPHFWEDTVSANFVTGEGAAEELQRAMDAAADRQDTKEYRRLKGILDAKKKGR